MQKSGRPLVMSPEERKERIFSVTEKLFCESGFENVSMSQISDAAGMSKKTLYVMFKDKTDLLQQLVLSSFILEIRDHELPPPDPVEELRLKLHGITRHVLSERHINLCRLAIFENRNNRQVSETFLEMGIGKSRDVLLTQLNAIPRDRYRLALPADHVAGMIFGASCSIHLVSSLLLGTNPDIDSALRSIDLTIEQLFSVKG